MNDLIYKQLSNLAAFRERLADERSREFLDSYVNYVLKRDMSLDEAVEREVEASTVIRPEIAFRRFMEGRDRGKIVVFGAGKDGRRTKRLLDRLDMTPAFFCDNDRGLWGTETDGVKVIDPLDLVYGYQDYVVLIGSSEYGREMVEQLIAMDFPQDHIFWSRTRILGVDLGWQYFDLPYFEKDAREVFVDCGCYDGGSSYDFAKWCGGKYEKIYAFEPDRRNYEICKEALAGLARSELHNAGVYDRTGVLKFFENGGGSRIGDAGGAEINTVSIDEVLNGDRATFIKMDVEGAELCALKGAERTIRTDCPKLAICMYHKLTDLIEIPEYLMGIVPEYTYAIRSYRSQWTETVLYAWKA